jgi:hypothetical protein
MKLKTMLLFYTNQSTLIHHTCIDEYIKVIFTEISWFADASNDDHRWNKCTLCTQCGDVSVPTFNIGWIRHRFKPQLRPCTSLSLKLVSFFPFELNPCEKCSKHLIFSHLKINSCQSESIGPTELSKHSQITHAYCTTQICV